MILPPTIGSRKPPQDNHLYQWQGDDQNQSQNFIFSHRQQSSMNHPRPYCPQSLQISADLIRGDTCDTWRFVYSLMGIWDEPATVPGYWHATPIGAGGSALILNSEFFILNWTYTFSAKERDPETGLSYFGSRYYSSDLSIWLSVDPMAAKYPSLSPYVYCADNPVRCVDPNGEEINPIFNKAGVYVGKTIDEAFST